MRTLFAALLSSALFVSTLSASPLKTDANANADGTDCIFAPACQGKDKGFKIAIPCEGMCSNYFECDGTANPPKYSSCDYPNRFHPTELVCKPPKAVDCKWYEQATTTANPGSSTSPGTGATGTMSPVPPASTTQKPNGASTISSATTLLVGVAIAAVAVRF